VISLVVFGWMPGKLFPKFSGRWRKKRRVCRVRAVTVEAELCKERGYRLSPRLQVMLWGNRRGT